MACWWGCRGVKHDHTQTADSDDTWLLDVVWKQHILSMIKICTRPKTAALIKALIRLVHSTEFASPYNGCVTRLRWRALLSLARRADKTELTPRLMCRSSPRCGWVPPGARPMRLRVPWAVDGIWKKQYRLRVRRRQGIFIPMTATIHQPHWLGPAPGEEFPEWQRRWGDPIHKSFPANGIRNRTLWNYAPSITPRPAPRRRQQHLTPHLSSASLLNLTRHLPAP